MNQYFFSEVTLLITHYNRSASLERLLNSFADLNCSFNEVIVSDDGSEEAHLTYIKQLQNRFKFKLLTSETNFGLGHNLNKGQKAATSALTLYVQEDFVPTSKFPGKFQNAVRLMDEDKDLDVVRFYAYYAYPYLRPFKQGYSEMLIKPFQLNYTKIYAYSDHPHLRRSSFLSKFGDYAEGIKGDRTEYRMCVSFIQKKGKGLFYNDFGSLFTQVNSEVEPSTMSRSNLSQSRNLIIKVVRDIYRQAKYNYDILFFTQK
ncbi:MAG: glycosyl transferase family 2 [Pedobacter sp.]|jgi:glycosyltransferase involved in cell wall biosynthesis|nr:glycosyl transferase family 2 [Pedobacter sp.]